MKRTTITTAAAGLLTLALVGGGAGAAQAKGGHDREVRRAGHCTAATVWKVKAKHDDGRIELEWEVDSNHAGQTWRVRVRDNGDRVVAARATTGGASGSYSVERRIANKSGGDSLVARARNLRSGQTCVGRVTV